MLIDSNEMALQAELRSELICPYGIGDVPPGFVEDWFPSPDRIISNCRRILESGAEAIQITFEHTSFVTSYARIHPNESFPDGQTVRMIGPDRSFFVFSLEGPCTRYRGCWTQWGGADIDDPILKNKLGAIRAFGFRLGRIHADGGDYHPDVQIIHLPEKKVNTAKDTQ